MIQHIKGINYHPIIYRLNVIFFEISEGFFVGRHSAALYMEI